MKTIFITGASSGLGKATAKLFRCRGWNVIATMRNPEKENQFGILENVTLVRLDVTDLEQIRSTVTDILSRVKADVVMNNAGYGLIGPLEAFSDEQINDQIQTNLFGVINVTRAFLPYFRERKEGMFVNVTSTFGLLGYPTCSIYNASKFGVDGFSEGLSHELAQFGVSVKVVAPGGMQTDFAGRSLQGAMHTAYARLTSKVSEGYSREQIANYTKAEDVADAVIAAVTDGKDQLRYVVGQDAIGLYSDRLENGPEAQTQKIKISFIS
ncbi:SDR family oxidoreductase [Pedobacter gandavensis]|uniref:SDR family oxidoreductase n=1 Tax=Pedobacter gandavensis TaxID=2679963 RepID=UPI0032AED08E